MSGTDKDRENPAPDSEAQAGEGGQPQAPDRAADEATRVVGAGGEAMAATPADLLKAAIGDHQDRVEPGPASSRLTEVRAEPADLAAGDGAPAEDVDSDRAEENGDPADASAGFERARSLAQRAREKSGGLLKDRYVLEQVIGEGGMGVVYKAHDLIRVEAEDRDSFIAAKVLSQNFKDHPDAFVALQQEAVKSQRLAHPNIVTVHDFDRDGDTVFMTMELLQGEPLDSLLQLHAPFGKDAALRYFSQLCAGLEYAHQRGYIHSDLKPGNIFVTTGGTVKILDLGIARAANRERHGHRFDAGDLGALTPAYATIEMIQGQPPSFSDDVYALACVLYKMLTGEHPYRERSAADARAAGLQAARPEGLSNSEWQALSQALEVDTGKRPATIAAFRRAMLPEARTYVSRVLAVLLVLVALGAGWLAFDAYRQGAQREAAISDGLAAARQCYFGENYACAIDNALLVTGLAPGNGEARELLQQARQAQRAQARAGAISAGMAAARACLEQGDHGCALVKARELLELEPGHLPAQQLLEQAQRARRDQQMAQLVAGVEDCLAREALDCARRQLEQARRAGALPAELYAVEKRTDELALAQQARASAQRERVRGLLLDALDCFDAGDYDCSDGKAAEVLALDAANAEAIELQQSARLARQARVRDEQTAARFLAEAQSCFDLKNYSCAIARSESALAIVPGYKAAAAMKSRALTAQEDAKKQILIQ